MPIREHLESEGHVDEDKFEIYVSVPKRMLEEIILDPLKWREFWGNAFIESVDQELLMFKGFVLNGFKPVTTPEEMKACALKMQELEKQSKIITGVPVRTNRRERRLGNGKNTFGHN